MTRSLHSLDCFLTTKRNAAGVIPSVEKSRAQYHHRFAGTLFQLQLDRRELTADYSDHPVNFLRHHWPRSALLAEQVHHVRREF